MNIFLATLLVGILSILTLHPVVGAEPWLECARVSSVPVIDGELADSAWRQCEKTAPFQLYGKPDTQVNGLWNQGESAFRNLTTVGAVVMTGDALYLGFHAEVASGATVKSEHVSGENIWEDDCVEFFLVTDDGTIRQLAFNSDGQWSGRLYSHADAVGAAWVPTSLQVAGVRGANGFSVEAALRWEDIGLSGSPEDGNHFRVNFTREGPSAGGLASWAPVGMKFLTPEAFGHMVVGNVAAYWQQRQEWLQQRLTQIDPSRIVPEELASLRQELEAFAAAFSRADADRGQLSDQWEALAQQLRRVENAGRLLIVQPVSPWKSFSETADAFPESTSPEICIRVPGSVPGVAAVGVTNLSRQNYLGRLIFHSPPGSLLTPERVQFRESGFVELAGGSRIADPLFDLPLGVMIRLPAGNANMIWLSINTAGLPPGEYAGELEFYSAYSGFVPETLPVKLVVSTVDLASASTRIWSYDAATPTALTRAANINTALVNPTLFYPEYDGEGQAVFPKLDRMISELLESASKKQLFLIFYPDYSVWGSEYTEGKELRFPTPEWQALVGPRYLQLRDHLQNAWGITPEQYAFCPIDEPCGDPEDPATRAWIGKTGSLFIKSLDPQFRTMGNPWRLNQETFYREYLKFYDILMPNIIEIRDRPDIQRELRESGREIWSYAVLSRTESPQLYRKLYWYNATCGFGDIAAFYALIHAVGDSFNNMDSGENFLPNHQPDPGNIQDFGTVYTLDWIGEQFVGTRRLAGWIQGQFDYKLARYCRDRIRECKSADAAAYERDLAEILAFGAAPDSDPEEACQRLLDLAEELMRLPD